MSSEQRTRKKASPLSAFLLLLAVLGGGFALRFVLRLFNLQFRAWIVTLFCISLVLLVFHLFFCLFRALSKFGSIPQEDNRKRMKRRLLSVCGIIVLLICFVIFCIYTFLLSVFSYKPEHVVEKHGQKMVTYTYNFLITRIAYYEYKNFIVCGYEEIDMEELNRLH